MDLFERDRALSSPKTLSTSPPMSPAYRRANAPAVLDAVVSPEHEATKKGGGQRSSATFGNIRFKDWFEQHYYKLIPLLFLIACFDRTP